MPGDFVVRLGGSLALPSAADRYHLTVAGKYSAISSS